MLSPGPGNELRARQACRELEAWGIYSAEPAYDATAGGYTGAISVDAEDLLAALNHAEARWQI